MPLLHESMARAFGLNCEAIQHSRLADGEVADIDHLLHFAFAFGDDLSSLERDELPKLVLELAQRVAETANGFAAHRPRRGTPFEKRFLRASDRLVVIVIRCGTDTGKSSSIDWRNLVDLCATTTPLTVEDAGV